MSRVTTPPAQPGHSTSATGNQAPRQPAHQIRLGRIKATIWENLTEYGVRHNVALCRIYKDGEHWKESSYFGRDDLPLAAKVADMAHTWIYEHNVSNHATAEFSTEDNAPF